MTSPHFGQLYSHNPREPPSIDKILDNCIPLESPSINFEDLLTSTYVEVIGEIEVKNTPSWDDVINEQSLLR